MSLFTALSYALINLSPPISTLIPFKFFFVAISFLFP